MSRLLSDYKCWVVVPAVDALLLLAVHVLAYTIRFEPGLNAAHWENIKFVLPWFVPAQLVILYYFGMYRDSWSRFNLFDALDVFKAALASLAVAAAVLLVYNYFQGFSRAVFLLDCILSFIVICGHRLTLFMLHKRLGPGNSSVSGQTVSKKRVLILGAGDAGMQLAKDVQGDPGLSC